MAVGCRSLTQRLGVIATRTPLIADQLTSREPLK
jgi:hypothetical protein